ncbi:MAG: ABC-F family ATP-binding cassette domain-containing protein [Verrucomicrobia bacterium]|nr:ABC-F family ATP-binding cassette domain-containing protein [Verrucomicrobiota bacterium]
MPSSVVSVSDASVKYGAQIILENATFNLDEQERVGLIGRNGVGKSTFLKIVAGELSPDTGTVARRRDLSIGFVSQTLNLEPDKTVEENVLSGARRVRDWIAEYERTPSDSPESARLFDLISRADGWNLESRLRALVNDLHAPEPGRLVRTLSGGEQRRVLFCRALLGRPDLLILDEPTNHLDPSSIEWLEDFLQRYPGTCLFVTHDRYFLDRAATRIVELARGQFASYEGNYTDYLLGRAERQAAEEQLERKRQKFLKQELAWVRKNPSARRTKSVDRVARYFELADRKPPEPEIDVELVIPPPPPLSERVIEADDLTLEMGGQILFRHLSFELKPGERLGVVGRNGAGKSSLLKAILGEVRPAGGIVRLGPRTIINYVDQGRTQLDDERTVWEEVGEGREYIPFGGQMITTRAYLRRFLFTDERINTRVSLLSGGERSRVILAKILRRGGNVLILDEPTNDLDLGTLRLLEEALTSFEGSAMVVSHDRYFLNRVCTATLVFEEGSQVRYYVGNYDYYVQKRGERENNTTAPAKAGSREGPAARRAAAACTPGKPRKLIWKEERELAQMEEQILAAEAEVERVERSFTDPDFFRKYGMQRLELEQKLAHARAEIERLYARWGELEAIRAGSQTDRTLPEPDSG